MRRMDAPEHYRERAEIARRMATEMTDEDLRERMEMVAEEYDQMALNSEAPHTKNRRKPATRSLDLPPVSQHR